MFVVRVVFRDVGLCFGSEHVGDEFVLVLSRLLALLFEAALSLFMAYLLTVLALGFVEMITVFDLVIWTAAMLAAWLVLVLGCRRLIGLWANSLRKWFG